MTIVEVTLRTFTNDSCFSNVDRCIAGSCHALRIPVSHNTSVALHSMCGLRVALSNRCQRDCRLRTQRVSVELGVAHRPQMAQLSVMFVEARIMLIVADAGLIQTRLADAYMKYFAERRRLLEYACVLDDRANRLWGSPGEFAPSIIIIVRTLLSFRLSSKLLFRARTILPLVSLL